MTNQVRNLLFSELRQANLERAEVFPCKRAPTPEFWAMALAGEVGELCNFMKKEFRDGVNLRHEIRKEIADVMIQLDLLAMALDIDLGSAVVDKFNEVSDRINCDIKL